MKAQLLVIAAILSGIAMQSATAEQEPQETRQNLMKDIGKSVGALGAIAKGEKPYDADVVRTAVTTINSNIKLFPDQFPEGSETGMETEARPEIWKNKQDFQAKADKLQTASASLLAEMPADQAGVQKAVQGLGPVCGDCHENYRVKK